MSIRRALVAAGSLAALSVVMLSTTAAQADAGSRAITCGMNVQSSVNLHLDRDLYCKAPYAIKVSFDNANDGTTPFVNIDLRGHVLYGTGSNTGIATYDYPNPTVVSVTHGRVEHFDVGMAGGGGNTITNVKFVDNHIGFSCWETCRIQGSYFKNNGTGFELTSESNGTIESTTFSGNAIGARVTGITSGLIAYRDTFKSNQTGLAVEDALARVDRSTFLDNALAMNFVNHDDDGACVTVTRNDLCGNTRDMGGNPQFC